MAQPISFDSETSRTTPLERSKSSDKVVSAELKNSDHASSNSHNAQNSTGNLNENDSGSIRDVACSKNKDNDSSADCDSQSPDVVCRRKLRSGSSVHYHPEKRRLRQTAARRQHTKTIQQDDYSDWKEHEEAHQQPSVKENIAKPLLDDTESGGWPTGKESEEKLSKDSKGSSASTTDLIVISSKEPFKGKEDGRQQRSKPETLVSLLWTGHEGMRTFTSSCSQAMTSSDKSEKENAVEELGEGRSSRILPSSEFRSGSHCSDFLGVSEVPDEAFLVTLSKDERKELNILTTSAGSVHMASSLQKLGLPGFCGPSTSRRTSVEKVQVSNKSENELAPNTPMKLSGVKGLTGTDNQPSGLSMRPVVLLTDDFMSKQEACKKGSREGRSSPGSSILQTPTTPKTSHKEEEKKRGRNLFQNMSDINSWSMVSGTGEDKENSEPTEDITVTNKGKRIKKDTDEAINASCEDMKTTEIVEKGCKNSLAAKSKFQPDISEETKCLTPSSQFPLVEGILACQNYPPFSGPSFDPLLLSEPRSNEFAKNRDSQSKSAVHLFKTAMVAVNPLPPLLSPDDMYSNTSKQAVKRSERIRSKNMPNLLPSLVVNKSVISTMKPSTHACKSNTGGLNMKQGKGSSTSSLKSSRKKKKWASGKTGKKQVEKKTRDFSKARANMSREVMAAIVKSIEETVSGASSENVDSRNFKPDDMSFNASKSFSCEVSNEEKGDNAQDSSLLDHSLSRPEDDNILTNNSPKTLFDSLCALPLELPDKIAEKRKTASNSGKKKTKKVTKSQPKIKSKSVPHGATSKSSKVKKRPRDKSALACTETCFDTQSLSKANAESGSNGKRSRKKTKKAEEALADYDIFCDDDCLPLKKSKTKKRPGVSACSKTPTAAPRRSRRWSEMDGMMSDPVLEQYAFMLWASEHRSELEQQHPSASVCELDTMLSSRWCDVADSAKARFFYRARDALGDDDRQVLRTTRTVSVADLEARLVNGFLLDRDPAYSDFACLPVDRQRELLRKWLKFFQRILPRKEYVEFIVNFKRASGGEELTPTGRPKRTRMRCLDPTHHKMLFDMIMMGRIRVLELFHDRRLKEKKILADSYSQMLRHLITNQPWTQFVPGCRSERLTDVLADLQHMLGYISQDDLAEEHSAGDVINSVAGPVNDAAVGRDAQGGGMYTEDCIRVGSMMEMIDDPLTCLGTLDEKTGIFQNPELDSLRSTLSPACGLDETDEAVLNTDLAQSLLSDLSQLPELPVIDQQTLDQVFLGPPRLLNTPSQPRQASGRFGRRLDSSPLPQLLTPPYGPGKCPSSPASPHLLSCGDPSPCSKRSIYHQSSFSTAMSSSVLHTPPSPLLPSHHAFSKGGGEMGGKAVCVGTRLTCARLDAKVEVHEYSTAAAVESLLHGGVSHPDTGLTRARCIKVHSKHYSQLPTDNRRKAGRDATPRLADEYEQPLQVPVSSLSKQQLDKFHPPRALPMSCSLQQRFSHSAQMFPPHTAGAPPPRSIMDNAFATGFPTKHSLHPMCQGALSSSRLYPQHLGLHCSPGPLITSLSPLRSIKTSASYGTHCQMVPYRPRLGFTGPRHATGYRKSNNPHGIPISTTFKSGAGSRSGTQGAGLHQFKVCLPTLPLKIPIAKLRGSKRTSYGKVKGKGVSLGPGKGIESVPGIIPCVTSTNVSPSPSHRGSPPLYAKPRPMPQSVLAKVLGFQMNADQGGISSTCISHPLPLPSSFCSTVSSPCSSSSSLSASHLRPMTVHSPTCAGKSLAQVQFVSMVSGSQACSGQGEAKTVMSPHTAVVVNPLHLHKRSVVSCMGPNSGRFARAVVTDFKSTAKLISGYTCNSAFTHDREDFVAKDIEESKTGCQEEYSSFKEDKENERLPPDLGTYGEDRVELLETKVSESSRNNMAALSVFCDQEALKDMRQVDLDSVSYKSKEACDGQSTSKHSQDNRSNGSVAEGKDMSTDRPGNRNFNTMNFISDIIRKECSEMMIKPQTCRTASQPLPRIFQATFRTTKLSTTTTASSTKTALFPLVSKPTSTLASKVVTSPSEKATNLQNCLCQLLSPDTSSVVKTNCCMCSACVNMKFKTSCPDENNDSPGLSIKDNSSSGKSEMAGSNRDAEKSHDVLSYKEIPFSHVSEHGNDVDIIMKTCDSMQHKPVVLHSVIPDDDETAVESDMPTCQGKMGTMVNIRKLSTSSVLVATPLSSVLPSSHPQGKTLIVERPEEKTEGVLHEAEEPKSECEIVTPCQVLCNSEVKETYSGDPKYSSDGKHTETVNEEVKPCPKFMHEAITTLDHHISPEASNIRPLTSGDGIRQVGVKEASTSSTMSALAVARTTTATTTTMSIEKVVSLDTKGQFACGSIHQASSSMVPSPTLTAHSSVVDINASQSLVTLTNARAPPGASACDTSNENNSSPTSNDTVKKRGHYVHEYLPT